MQTLQKLTAIALSLSLIGLSSLTGCDDSSGSGGGLAAQRFPAAVIEPTSLVFAGVALGQTDTRSFTITNAGGAQLGIFEISPSNGLDAREFQIEPLQGRNQDAIVLQANESLEVRIAYTPRDPGTDMGRITVVTNDPDEPEQTVIVRSVEARQELFANPDRLLFGQVDSGAMATLPLSISNRGAVPVEIADLVFADGSSPDFTITGNADARPTLERDQEIIYDITYTPEGLNADEGVLLVRTTEGIEVPVDLRGEETRPRVEITPEVAAFGAVELMEVTDPKEIFIQNIGNAPLEVTRVYPAQAVDEDNEQFIWMDLPVEPQVLQPRESFSVSIQYAPQVIGAHDTKLVVESNDPEQPFASIDVTGRVRRPCIAVMPDSVNFGTVAQGVEGGPFQVRVVNCGDQDLELENLRIEGDQNFRFEPAEGNDPNSPIPANGVVTLEVFYNNVGLIEGMPANGTLMMESNDPENPEVQVQLFVTGGGAPSCNLVILPNPVDFGLVSRGGTRARTVDVVNSGTGNCEVRGQDISPLVAIPLPGFDMVNFIITAPIRRARLGPGSFNEMELTYRPQVFNADSALLQVTYWDPYMMEERIAEARLIGVSGESDIQVIPERLDFGQVTAAQCASREERITVYNTGIINICITDIALEGPGCNEFFIVDRPVANEEGCILVNRNTPAEVRLQYEPANLGTDECTLVFESDANNNPELRVPLTGEGVPDSATVDEFEQISGRAVDVLLVIDNSGSMSEEQQNLRDNFRTFLQGAQQFENDFHIGVITTDMTDPDESGRLQGNPRIVPRNNDTERLVRATADVGTGGDGDERGLEATQKALSNPLAFDTGVACNGNADCVMPDECVNGFCGGYNRGFVRDGARLEIVWLSDEDDSSPATLNFYVDFIKNIKGFRNEALLGTNAIVGADGGRARDCEGPGGNAAAGRRFVELADRTNGQVFSICDANFGASLREIGNRAFGLQVQFFLSRPADPATIAVQVNGQAVNGGWAFDRESNSVVFEEARVPAAGSRIRVSYEAVCFPRRR